MSDLEKYDELRKQVFKLLNAYHETLGKNQLDREWQVFYGELNALERIV